MPSGGPSHFVDVSNVVYNGIAIAGVRIISVDRKKNVLKGKDNNKLRPVSAHVVEVMDTVTIESEDVYALEECLGVSAGSTGHSITFDWVAAETQVVTTSPLATQAVTIAGVVFEGQNIKAPSKDHGTFSINGFCLEQAGGADPVSFADAS